MAQPQQVVFPPTNVFKLFDLEAATNVFTPSADSTGVLVVTTSDGLTDVFRVDTTNKAVLVGGAMADDYYDPLIHFYVSADSDSYSGINVVNASSGTSATSDVVVVNDSAEGYAEIGISSSANADPTFPILQAGVGFAYSHNTNFVVGSGADLVLFAGGFETTNIGATLAGTGGWTFSQAATFSEGLTIGGETNYMTVDSGGNLSLAGTAIYKRHVQIDAKLDGSPANQPNSVDFSTAGGLQFITSGAKYAFCQWEVPDDWDGTDVYFEIDWFPDSGATSGTDAVRWTVEYRAIAEGETINNGTSVTVDNGAGGDTADYSQYQTKHTRFTLTYNNANQPLTKQDHVYFKISRDTAVANDFGGSVTVTAYEIIYNSTGFPTSN